RGGELVHRHARERGKAAALRAPPGTPGRAPRDRRDGLRRGPRRRRHRGAAARTRRRGWSGAGARARGRRTVLTSCPPLRHAERGNWGAGPRAPQDPGRLRRALHLLRDDARAGRESVAGNPGTGSGSTGARGAPRGDRADGDTYRHVWAGSAWVDRPRGHAPGFTGGFGSRLPRGTAPGLVYP